MPTTRLQHPGYFVLNTETYKLARKKNGTPYWRRSRIRVQPGQGEKIITWDRLDGGIGEGRYQTGRMLSYNDGGSTITPWKLGPAPDKNAITSVQTGKTWTRAIEYNGYVYIIGHTTADKDLYYMRIDPTAPATIVTNAEPGLGLADGPPGQCTVWENKLCVGVTVADKYAYQVGITNSWVSGTDAETKEAHYQRVGRDLWSVSNVAGGEAKVRKLAAGATWDGANRGSQYNVGDTGLAIKSLAEWGRWLYVGKPEGLFSGDEDGNMWNVLPAVLKSANNNLRLGHFLHYLMAPTTVGAYRHAGAASVTVGVEELPLNTGAIKGGYFRAFATAGKWLYGAYQVSTTAYLMVGRLRTADDPPGPSMVWHCFYSLATTTVDDMLVTDLGTAPILYVVAGTADPFFFYLAADGSLDPTDSNCDFETSTDIFYLSAVDLNNPGTPQLGHWVEVQGSGTWDANRKVTIAADWDGGGYNNINTTSSDVITSGYNRIFWTQGTNDSGRSCQIRLTLANNNATTVPFIEKVAASFIEQPRTEPGFEAVVCLYDMADKKRPVEKQQTDLEALVETGVYNLTDPDDPDAANLTVILHEMEEYDLKQEGECSKHSHVRLIFRQVVYA